MCVPLVTADGQPLGALQLDTQDVGKKFREDDLKLLTIVANLATVVDREGAGPRAAAGPGEGARGDRARPQGPARVPAADLPRAGRVRVLRVLQPGHDGRRRLLRLHHPAHGRVAVVLGDVAGKGVPAALLMAKLSAEVRFCMLTEPDPARAVSLLERPAHPRRDRRPVRHPGGVVIDPAAHEIDGGQRRAHQPDPGPRRRGRLRGGHHERRERAAARDRSPGTSLRGQGVPPGPGGHADGVHRRGDRRGKPGRGAVPARRHPHGPADGRGGRRPTAGRRGSGTG